MAIKLSTKQYPDVRGSNIEYFLALHMRKRLTKNTINEVKAIFIINNIKDMEITLKWKIYILENPEMAKNREGIERKPKYRVINNKGI